jgi:uncharacterized membrane-anchored protein YjiN (DUF445 family)
VQTDLSAAEQVLARRLARMKRIPLLLLALMAALFAFTLRRPEVWAGWLHAFAEAGMVGALADWFAVTALFRHPLGIPIPHTAIIPRRKDELGESMAKFVSDHFLDPGAVRAKLASIDLAGIGVQWLNSERGRNSLVSLGETAILWLLDSLDEQRVRRFLARLSRRQMEQVNLAAVLGHTLEWLAKDGRHQDILTQLVQRSIVMLHEHREGIREKVKQESPWWLPGFVDDRILKQMLERVETRLWEVSLDPAHPMRTQFDSWVLSLAEELKTSTGYRLAGERWRKQLLDNQALQDYLYGLWEDLALRLRSDLDDGDSKFRSELHGWLQRLAQELEADAEVRAWLDQWLSTALVAVVDRNRRQIASLISDTVKTWDGVATSRRVELALGRDLQFIRINGTLVGGLVGLAIHALTLL